MSASQPTGTAQSSSPAAQSDGSSTTSSVWFTMGDVADFERISIVLAGLTPYQFEAMKDLIAKINAFGADTVINQLEVTDLDDWDVPIAEFTTRAQRRVMMADRRRWRCDRCGAINRGCEDCELCGYDSE
ncbi:hypothetical protein VNI00_016642 [Paramarasmius palmivorus]|uniref:RanBP2-type domain-containing protein n=1 Tax=Paramarasmius palmivorus TaxID=297713 RepID=A0AAW0BB24_9AGAR